jgi:hypothetical protein
MRERFHGNAAKPAALALFLISGRADAEQEPIDLVYRAYEGCPSEKQFLELVVGRAAETLVASERARGRRFLVSVIPQRKETIGKLEILSGGTAAAREVKGSNCAEVVSALALFTALAIDPSASTELAPEPAPRDERGSPQPGSEPRGSAPPESNPEARPAAPAPRSAGEDEHPSPGVKSTPERGEILAGARATGAGGFVGGSVTPATALGGGFFVQWTTPGFGAYRLNGAYFLKSETSDATFAFFAGRIDACPVGLRPAARLTVETCLSLEVGSVEAAAKARATISPSTERRWWTAGDVLGRVRYVPISWIFAEIEGGASVPFTRYVFLLGNQTNVKGEIHRVPAIGWVLGFEVGARIL